ncbi:FAD/NAD(P)-binding domain-containing protein, partial [Aureobasidium melanogenum]
MMRTEPNSFRLSSSLEDAQHGKRFVINGGSFAGIRTAHGILKQIPTARVTLINPSSQFFYNIASPRILAKSSAFQPEQYLINIPNLLARHDSTLFRFVEGLATAIDEQHRVVKLANLDKIPYDYLIIASGSTTQPTEGLDSDMAPWKARQDGQTLECMMESQKNIAAAEYIVTCDAGPVGVKFAGEIADVLRKDGKNRSVTLISGTTTILPRVDERVGRHAMAILTRQGVKVVRESKVVLAHRDISSSKGTINLQEGTTMSSDCFISTTGLLPNNKFLPSHFLDEQGWTKVDMYLRAVSAVATNENLSRVYAIGNIVAYQPRTVRALNEQLPVILATLEADLHAMSPGEKLSLTYPPSPITSIMIPIEDSAGTGLIFGMVPWELVIWLIKGRNFLIPYIHRFLSW